eukprot:TRINITY_DN11193_c0_g1_i8.p1 TRINITY_DN11193_c0_g1~~TRINITY_DN11193_c0_g1_i8.p1  ORF type:complete len:341 (+),score=79.08 TRINITY_DN11193_c0_g1_i8:228-1250(+)
MAKGTSTLRHDQAMEVLCVVGGGSSRGCSGWIGGMGGCLCDYVRANLEDHEEQASSFECDVTDGTIRFLYGSQRVVLRLGIQDDGALLQECSWLHERLTLKHQAEHIADLSTSAKEVMCMLKFWMCEQLNEPDRLPLYAVEVVVANHAKCGLGMEDPEQFRCEMVRSFCEFISQQPRELFDPTNPRTNLLKGRNLEPIARLAQEQLAAGLERFGSTFDHAQLQREVNSASKGAETAEVLFDMAMNAQSQAIGRESNEHAASLYAKALESYPDHVPALIRLGLVLMEQDKLYQACLLYTSDAADEEDSVDLGGRRIIKKKKKNTQMYHNNSRYEEDQELRM